jgi:hypothetical protein
MNGRGEVKRSKQRLDATFKHFQGIGPDPELQSNFAKYLCVLVSGYLEKAVSELVVEHARKNGAPSLQRFVDQRTKRFANAKSQRLNDIMGDFDSEWRAALEVHVEGDL